MTRISLDLNSPIFQQDLFSLQKQEQLQVLKTLKKIIAMNWEQLYTDPGLKWELIRSRTGSQEQRLYSFRISKSCRGIGFRDNQWLIILSLHPDHDSAYD